MAEQKTIWIIPPGMDSNSFANVASFMQFLGAVFGVTNDAFKQYACGIVSSEPVGKLAPKTLFAVSDRGWRLSDRSDSFGAAAAFFYLCEQHRPSGRYLSQLWERDEDGSAFKAGIREKIAERIGKPPAETCPVFAFQRNRGETNWEVGPIAMLKHFCPLKWIDPGELKRAFPGEPFAEVSKPARSPYTRALEVLKNRPNLVIEDKRGFPRRPPSKELLGSLDDALLDFGPMLIAQHFRGECWLRDYVELVTEKDKRNQRTRVCAIPSFAGMTSIDALLYLTAIGKLPGELPIEVARKLLDDNFDWKLPLRAVSTIGAKKLELAEVPEIPDEGVLLNALRLQENDLALEFQGSAEIVARNWRACDDPIWGPINAQPEGAAGSDVAASALHEVKASNDLMRLGSQYVWLSLATPPQWLLGVSPPAILLNAITVDLATRLSVMRATGIPTLEQAKQREIEAADMTEVLVSRLVKGILSKYTPWPEPYARREAADGTWKWTPKGCLKDVRPLFQTFIDAPMRDEPRNLVASFLNLIQSDPLICYAWPTPLKEAWNFKLKTSDRTWISGVIWESPDVSAAGADERGAGLKVSGGEAGYFRLEVGNCSCVIEEKST